MFVQALQSRAGSRASTPQPAVCRRGSATHLGLSVAPSPPTQIPQPAPRQSQQPLSQAETPGSESYNLGTLFRDSPQPVASQSDQARRLPAQDAPVPLPRTPVRPQPPMQPPSPQIIILPSQALPQAQPALPPAAPIPSKLQPPRPWLWLQVPLQVLIPQPPVQLAPILAQQLAPQMPLWSDGDSAPAQPYPEASPGYASVSSDMEVEEITGSMRSVSVNPVYKTETVVGARGQRTTTTKTRPYTQLQKRYADTTPLHPSWYKSRTFDRRGKPPIASHGKKPEVRHAKAYGGPESPVGSPRMSPRSSPRGSPEINLSWNAVSRQNLWGKYARR
ncbi:uncharacterized protein LOC135192882 [Pogoniulus pusillus]|uniref:uncharacterized protein LOC135192882 n=1 Tax=Pogoniulus pusillus TaxID=488313 RepID=UPI0030B952ED